MTGNEMALMASITVDMQNKKVNKVLEQIRDEIIQMNSLDYVEPISCEEVLEIIDKYKGKE